MKTCTVGMSAESGEGRRQSPAFILATRPALLDWINDHELEELRETLAHGNLPADFLSKLKRLAGERVDIVDLQKSPHPASGYRLPIGWGEKRGEGQPVSHQPPFAPGMSHLFIAQNCRLFATLLLATEAGEFRDPSPAERERLLRVLDYVRKEDDAVPDYAPAGFTDDQQEVRAVMVELGGLLAAFKSWRLRHQVPGMWGEAGTRIED